MKTHTWNPATDPIERPLFWRKPSRIFVVSDLFHDDVPVDSIADIFGVMAVTGAVFLGGARTMRVGTRYEQGRPPEAILSFGSKHGPHLFRVQTKCQERIGKLLIDRRFKIEVSRSAYRWAQDRVDAGYLMDRIQDGRMWPLPNVHFDVSNDLR